MSMSDNTNKTRHINEGNKEKYTCMYKKQYKQDKQYTRGSWRGVQQWVEQLTMGWKYFYMH